MSQRTLADLAGSLGFTRNALYHYVKDFEDLLSQVYRRSCILLGERLDEAMSQRDPSDILRAFVSTALDGKRAEIAALNEYGLLRPDARAEVTTLYRGIEGRLAAVIADGVDARTFRPCDPALVARADEVTPGGRPLIWQGRPAVIGALESAGYSAVSPG